MGKEEPPRLGDEMLRLLRLETLRYMPKMCDMQTRMRDFQCQENDVEEIADRNGPNSDLFSFCHDGRL